MQFDNKSKWYRMDKKYNIKYLSTFNVFKLHK